VTNIIVAFPKPEEGRSIERLLKRSGFSVIAVCTAGSQVMSQLDDLNDGIIVCGCRLTDMAYTELAGYLPDGFEMLLIASRRIVSERSYPDIMSLSMPLKVPELLQTVSMMVEAMERRRRRRRAQPKVRTKQEQGLIDEAKRLLMERNGMTEEEAHRYIQKCSMDNGTNLTETAQMVLALLHD